MTEIKGDLISRETLKEHIKNAFKHNFNGHDALLVDEIYEFIDNAPPISPYKALHDELHKGEEGGVG